MKISVCQTGNYKFLDDAVRDYNYERPHYKHFPKTPSEVYFGTDLKLDIKKQASKAAHQRVQNNLKTACRICRNPMENSSVTPTSLSSSTFFKKHNLR
jgi:5-methylcytosine-specific restriction endonuclease McrA